MAKRRSQERGYVEQIDGQLTIWDIEIAQKPTSFTKSEENITKKDVSFTKNFKESISKKNEKHIKPLELTDSQQEFLNKNDVMKNDNLYRVLIYPSGGLGIETKAGDKFRTIYVNGQGKKEFESNKKSLVIPMDKIIYYKEDLKPNELQEEKLKQLKKLMNIIKVIKRNGDENIIIELEERILVINSKGWILPFNECKAIYSNKEVVNLIKEKKCNTVDLRTIQNNVKVGDVVQAYHGKDLIQGKITHIYGGCNESLCIIFDDGKKYTAIPRIAVKKILKSA